jgi:MacB-like periplasmic core domain
MHDLRLALRALSAAPIVTAVAVVSLALGIGVNTAIFSLVNSVMLRPLPVAAPDRLFILSSEGSHGLQWAWNYSVWEQIRARPELFDGVAAWGRSRFNLAQGGETHFVDGLFANGSFFSTLGVPAALGRTFTDADDVRGGGRLVPSPSSVTVSGSADSAAPTAPSGARSRWTALPSPSSGSRLQISSVRKSDGRSTSSCRSATSRSSTAGRRGSISAGGTG